MSTPEEYQAKFAAEMLERDRHHRELMALPVKAGCECQHQTGVKDADGNAVPGLESWGGLAVDPQCPHHGVRAAAGEVQGFGYRVQPESWDEWGRPEFGENPRGYFGYHGSDENRMPLTALRYDVVTGRPRTDCMRCGANLEPTRGQHVEGCPNSAAARYARRTGETP